MTRMMKSSASLVLLSITSGLLPVARAQGLQDDFVTEDLPGTFTQATSLRFASNADMLVTEKSGLVWDVRNGAKRAIPVIDLRQEVLNNGDRGLLTVAVDPRWATNGYIYLLYVVDPDGDGIDDEMESFGRLARFTTSFASNGDLIADPVSRLVLIGATWPEGLPSLHLSHSVGDVRFAADGSLFVSTGDGAHFDLTDPGGFDPNGFGPGKFDVSEDIGAFRAQSMTSLVGKILRIDPVTGLGLADNPFFTGNAADHQSRIWALGLRNPFRFCLVPGTGPIEQLYVCDVGWETWEELDACRGGENFGWPCNEGPAAQSSYANADLLGRCDDPSLFTPPLWCYHHYQYVPPMSPDFVGQCTAGACVYTGTEYPAAYQGRVFLGDYASEWIRSLVVIDGVAMQSDRFVTEAGHPVDITPDPVNGDLLYSALSANVIRRIRYTKADRPPVALATITPTFGPSPLVVSFDATASYDPEGGSLVYDWDLGDGTRSSVPVLAHAYADKGSYAVVLTVADPLGKTAALTQRIAVDDSPPTIESIDAPAPGSFYSVGQPLAFDATVSDVEDDRAEIPVDVEWVVDLVHDHHVHPSWATLVGAHASYVPPVHGEGVYLHVTLNATDSGGLSSSRDFVLYDVDAKPEPHLVTLSSFSPRIGHSIQATGHIHYAGLGDVDLEFDWGDGARDTFRASHLVDCTPIHTYAAPGTYALRFTTRNSTDSITVTQPVVVRPLVPEVAIFAPLVVAHFVPIADQWTIATGLVDALHGAGFEGKIFGADDQVALRQWMTANMRDSPRDWLICLDVGASSVHAGKDDGSLAERWLEAGNGMVWTGFNPFSQYLTTDGIEKSRGAGAWALDELLDAATPRLVEGSGHMSLRPDGAELPSLQPFDSSLALMTARLNSDWTIARLYASNGATPAVSDALVLRSRNGGEYAQFYCVDDATLPREGVLRDFLASHVYSHLPKGPSAFALVRPAPKERVTVREPTLVWNTTPDATSWLIEVVTDATDAEPVFTATVMRSGTSVEKTASVQVTAPLVSGRLYRWRVTARNDFGARASDIREFRFEGADRHR